MGFRTKLTGTIRKLAGQSDSRRDRAGALAATYSRFASFTMVPPDSYIANLKLALRHSEVDGAIVECGTWKGGMIAGIAHLLGDRKEYWLFDSFEGLPPARDVDGEAALRWQADTAAPAYFNNCIAAESDARAAMKLAGTSRVQIRKGWFCDTLSSASFEGGISVLRIDADWYDSTMDVLTRLFSKVNRGGCIIIDDYYIWDGCSKAVHDFLSRLQAAERIACQDGLCYIVKR